MLVEVEWVADGDVGKDEAAGSLRLHRGQERASVNLIKLFTAVIYKLAKA